MKAEREARVENDMAIARRRQEELVARQAMAARQQQQQQQQAVSPIDCSTWNIALITFCV